MYVRWYPTTGFKSWARPLRYSSCWPDEGGSRGWDHFHPRADVIESDEDYTVHLELPGVIKDDVKISLHDGILTVSGEKKIENEETEEKEYRLYERVSGRFERSFQFRNEVDEGSIAAGYLDGVLTIRLPKTEEEKPREIPIKNGK